MTPYRHDISPWFNYFLGTILGAYKEFEERAGDIKPARGVKTEIITKAIQKQFGEFTISDVEKECPGVSRDMIRVIFRQLKKEKKIRCLGKGKSAKWQKV